MNGLRGMDVAPRNTNFRIQYTQTAVNGPNAADEDEGSDTGIPTPASIDDDGEDIIEVGLDAPQSSSNGSPGQSGPSGAGTPAPISHASASVEGGARSARGGHPGWKGE